MSGNAYIPEGRSLLLGSPFVVICRDPGVLTSTVEVTSVGGGYVVKSAPKGGRGSRQAEALQGSRGDLNAARREGGMEGN